MKGFFYFFINKGKIVAFNTPQALKDIIGGNVVSLDVAQKSEMPHFVEIIRDRHPFPILKVEATQGIITIFCQQGEKSIPHLMILAEESHLEIQSVEIQNFLKFQTQIGSNNENIKRTTHNCFE